eukprot:758317-Hanusia_phi.AAC.3
METDQDLETRTNQKTTDVGGYDKDGKRILPRQIRDTVLHCHQYYNELFGNSGFRISDDSSENWDFCLNSSDPSSEQWEVSSDGVDEEMREAEDLTAAFVVQLTIAGSISYSPDRYPKADTKLDSIDVALQLKALREYGSSTILLGGICPGSRVGRWFQVDLIFFALL